MLKRALFLDRDGTVIVDRGYMKDPNQVELLPGASDALRKLAREGWKLIIVGNQSGVGRGLITKEEMDAVQAKFLRLMKSNGIEITASYFCIHAPEDNCECRKPATLSVEKAARDHAISAEQSWMIGDRESDILCGRNAGCSTIWLRNKEYPVAPELPDFIANNWGDIYERISSDTDT